MRYARWSTALILPALLVGLCAFLGRWPGHPDATSAKTKSASESLVAVFGQVQDDKGPVAGARVRLKGLPDAVLTGVDGHFNLLSRPQGLRHITAWKEGYLIGGAAGDVSPVVIHLKRLPREDNEHYIWTDPQPDPVHGQNCGNCHAEIHREWSASGHAGSVDNRHFVNLYEGSDWHGRPNIGWSLLAEHPDGAGVCTACHAPTVAFDDPAYYDLGKAQGTAARGVHCDYCHKVADMANEHFGQTHGRFGLKLLRPTDGQLFFGPLDDVDRGEDTFAAIYRDSRYCASCHEGRVFGVPVYTTYSEWLASPARQEGKHCQTCHMAPTGTLDNVAPGMGGIPRDPGTLANHRLFAGSQFEMLKNCLKVDITVASSADEVQVEAKVQAEQVGHRVPTGFADRNLVLIVEAFDPNGRDVPLLAGRLLPPGAGKRFAGRPGRLYAKQLRDFDGRWPVPFWRAQPEVDDRRLIPGQADHSSYRFPAGPSRVQVRLVYRRFWEEVAILKDWPDNEIEVADHVIPVRSP
jgi:Cytochrome c554 and c-prime